MKKFKTYILYDGRYYKIGKSKDVERRYKEIKAINIYVKILHIFDSDIEKSLHKLFKEKRIEGEWFSLDENDIEYILNNLNHISDNRGSNSKKSKEVILSEDNINFNDKMFITIEDFIHTNIGADYFKNRRFLYNPDYNLTTTEKRSNSLKFLNKVKSEKVFKELENIIDNWDASLGKITQTKLAEVSKKNIKTVEKHYKNLKEKVKNFNKSLQDKK